MSKPTPAGMYPPEWDMIISAAQKNRPTIIRELAAQGVPPSHHNAVRQSALHVAALWGHHECVQVLCDLGADLNARNDLTGGTPLHMVAVSQKGSPEARLKVVEILVQAGASVDLADHHGSLPVHALQVGDSSSPSGDGEGDEMKERFAMTRRFVEILQPKRPDIEVALIERSVARVEAILAEDTESSNAKFQKETPVSYAVDALVKAVIHGETEDNEIPNLLEILKLLLNNGADANGNQEDSANGPQGLEEKKEAPLHRVVSSLRDLYKASEDDESTPATVTLEEMIDVLMEGGATVTQETAELLHQATRRKETRLARLLLDRLKVDPNTKGRQGLTPLHFAARSGQVTMLRLLLEQQTIDIHVQDDRGKTALDAARVNQKDDVVQILEEID